MEIYSNPFIHQACLTSLAQADPPASQGSRREPVSGQGHLSPPCCGPRWRQFFRTFHHREVHSAVPAVRGRAAGGRAGNEDIVLLAGTDASFHNDFVSSCRSRPDTAGNRGPFNFVGMKQCSSSLSPGPRPAPRLRTDSDSIPNHAECRLKAASSIECAPDLCGGSCQSTDEIVQGTGRFRCFSLNQMSVLGAVTPQPPGATEWSGSDHCPVGWSSKARAPGLQPFRQRHVNLAGSGRCLDIMERFSHKSPTTRQKTRGTSRRAMCASPDSLHSPTDHCQLLRMQ